MNELKREDDEVVQKRNDMELNLRLRIQILTDILNSDSELKVQAVDREREEIEHATRKILLCIYCMSSNLCLK